MSKSQEIPLGTKVRVKFLSEHSPDYLEEIDGQTGVVIHSRDYYDSYFRYGIYFPHIKNSPNLHDLNGHAMGNHGWFVDSPFVFPVLKDFIPDKEYEELYE